MSGRVSANWIILIAALAAGLGLWLGMRTFAPNASAPRELQSGVLFAQPRPIPPFELARSDGAKLTHADWTGRWTIAFFGYTNCPDVCPTTLATFAQAWKKLDPATRDKLRFDFISVDPARDTPGQLARYVGYFDKDFVGLTGSIEDTQALANGLSIPFIPADTSKPGYTVDHSGNLAVVGPDGRQRGFIRAPMNNQKLVAQLPGLVKRD